MIEELEINLSYDVKLKDKLLLDRIAFDVPENISCIKIKFEVQKNTGNFIDFGVESPEGFKGWSGSSKDEVFISEEWSTPGYSIGKIQSGKWNLLVGLSKLTCDHEIKINILLEKTMPKWYKGDLHMHTIHSDGDYELHDVVRHCKEAGLDYIAITDHNAFTQNKTYANSLDIIKIPAFELTTYRGHSNFYGLNEPTSGIICNSPEDVQKFINEGRANGALVSLNHPFFKDEWTWGIDRYEFKFVEIWNGPWSQGNMTAIKWWHNELCLKRRVIALGGSDTHRRAGERWYGNPTTMIKSDDRNIKGLLNGVENGRVCVCNSPDSSYLDLKIGDSVMGQYVKFNQELVITIFGVHKGIIKIYNNNGLVLEKELNSNVRELKLDTDVNAIFYRAEFWSMEDIPYCISNAIWNEL